MTGVPRCRPRVPFRGREGGFDMLQRTLRAIDDFQQRRRWLAFPFAVNKKFGDDQGGYLAALIAYYGFFSLFPLLLVFTSALGFVVHKDSSLYHSIVNSALRNFPVIGRDLSLGTIKGSGLALAVG